MKITIVGAGNMGGAIARGLATDAHCRLTVIDISEDNLQKLKIACPNIKTEVAIYNSLSSADVIILAVKPWLVEQLIGTHKHLLGNSNQIIASVAAGISLSQLNSWIGIAKPIFRIMPNTAIAFKQSMTFVSSVNASQAHNEQILKVFASLGKVELIDETSFSAGTSLASCGIAFALRYIRASMEGGIELGLYPHQSKEIVLQTLRGAIALLENTDSHPEAEIDKVTTAGGITIKGLNEMEHAGFTSAVIKGLKASKID